MAETTEPTVVADPIVAPTDTAPVTLLGGDPAKPTAPEKYDLKLAEKTQLDKSDVERISAFAREKGLSNEQAQGIVDQSDATAAAFSARQATLLQETSEQWRTQTLADPEIGGTHYVTTDTNCRLVMDRFAPGKEHPIRQFLAETGFGNHPDVVRFINQIGAAMAEDTTLPKNSGQPANNADQPMHVRIYGKEKYD